MRGLPLSPGITRSSGEAHKHHVFRRQRRQGLLLKCCKGELEQPGEHMLIRTHAPPQLARTHTLLSQMLLQHLIIKGMHQLLEIMRCQLPFYSSPPLPFLPHLPQESCHSLTSPSSRAGPDTTCQVLQQERLQLECAAALPAFHLGEVNDGSDYSIKKKELSNTLSSERRDPKMAVVEKAERVSRRRTRAAE